MHTIVLLSFLLLFLVEAGECLRFQAYSISEMGVKLRNNVQLMALQLPKNLKKRRRAPAALPDLSQAQFPTPPSEGYDLVVLGSGPGGESAATEAAKLGARVAVVEKKTAFGGPTGLSSKAVREATKR